MTMDFGDDHPFHFGVEPGFRTQVSELAHRAMDEVRSGGRKVALDVLAFMPAALTDPYSLSPGESRL